MKVLIIGSKGFIGSHCYSRLKQSAGMAVYGADVVIDYNDPEYFLIDATNADFKNIFALHQFDWCINCAGAASVPDSFRNPERDYLLNVHHLALLLNAIRTEGSRCKLVQLSSAAVYGNPTILPVSETAELSPLSPYGIHKKQAEELCKMYFEHFGVRSSVLRVFSAYGRGLQKQLFWDLYKKMESSQEIVLHGTGNETREFIHVSDIVHAIRVIIQANDVGHQVINIANTEPLSIREAANAFFRNMDFHGHVSFNGINRAGDPLYWQADTSLLRDLGYRQQISFTEGIGDYCEWLRDIK